jgi:hypothetical protein
MNDNQFKPTIGEEDVISLKNCSPNNVIMYNHTLKVKQAIRYCLMKILEVSKFSDLENNDSYKPRMKWIDEGLECEVLNLGANQWKKGKVRIKVSFEFCPDEPEISEYESPLDEIRREMQNQS